MDKEDYELYVLAEIRYQELHPDKEFPIDWYSINDYRLKTNIICEAIEKGVLIEDTPLYVNRFINNTFIS